MFRNKSTSHLPTRSLRRWAIATVAVLGCGDAPNDTAATTDRSSGGTGGLTGGSSDVGAGGSGGVGGSGGSPTALPICGNGIREVPEDCDGIDLGGASCATLGTKGSLPRCASNCVFDMSTCTYREACVDDIDNNEDGRIDCADPDCIGNPICVPGTRAVGEPCETPSDCAATGGDPMCIGWSQSYVFELWVNNYCSEGCNTELQDCPIGSTCMPGFASGSPTPWGFCLRSCPTGGECPLGYFCHNSGVGPVCQQGYH